MGKMESNHLKSEGGEKKQGQYIVVPPNKRRTGILLEGKRRDSKGRSYHNWKCMFPMNKPSLKRFLDAILIPDWGRK